MGLSSEGMPFTACYHIRLPAYFAGWRGTFSEKSFCLMNHYLGPVALGDSIFRGTFVGRLDIATGWKTALTAFSSRGFTQKPDQAASFSCAFQV